MSAQAIASPSVGPSSSSFDVARKPPVSYLMRALASPGPGEVAWVSKGAQDFAGAKAPAAIQGGSAVVAANWTG